MTLEIKDRNELWDLSHFQVSALNSNGNSIEELAVYNWTIKLNYQPDFSEIMIVTHTRCHQQSDPLIINVSDIPVLENIEPFPPLCNNKGIILQ